MTMAIDAAQRLQLLDDEALIARQRALFTACHLPVMHQCDDVQQEAETLASHCKLDKKVRAGNTRFVLPKSAGAIEIVENPASDVIVASFAACCESTAS